jgi:hypothetical protein
MKDGAVLRIEPVSRIERQKMNLSPFGESRGLVHDEVTIVYARLESHVERILRVGQESSSTVPAAAGVAVTPVTGILAAFVAAAAGGSCLCRSEEAERERLSARIRMRCFARVSRQAPLLACGDTRNTHPQRPPLSASPHGSDNRRFSTLGARFGRIVEPGRPLRFMMRRERRRSERGFSCLAELPAASRSSSPSLSSPLPPGPGQERLGTQLLRRAPVS